MAFSNSYLFTLIAIDGTGSVQKLIDFARIPDFALDQEYTYILQFKIITLLP